MLMQSQQTMRQVRSNSKNFTYNELLNVQCKNAWKPCRRARSQCLWLAARRCCLRTALKIWGSLLRLWACLATWAAWPEVFWAGNRPSRWDTTGETLWKKPTWSFWPVPFAISGLATAVRWASQPLSLPSTGTVISCTRWFWFKVFQKNWSNLISYLERRNFLEANYCRSSRPVSVFVQTGYVPLWLQMWSCLAVEARRTRCQKRREKWEGNLIITLR